MSKIYLLLRNNQQAGPYTLEELLQLNLKPYDLIWVEGRSTGWRNPSEINEINQNLHPSPTHTNSIQTINNYSPSKPLERHIYVSLPPGKQALPLKEESNISFDERVAQLQQKINGVNDKQDDEVETKYTRSLDDIKQEYSSWLQNKRKPKFTFNTKYLSAAVVMLVVVAGIFLFSKINFVSSANQKLAANNQSLVVGPSPVKMQTAQAEINDVETKKDVIKQAETKESKRAVKPVKEKAEAQFIPEPSPVKEEEKKPISKENSTTSKQPLTSLIHINGKIINTSKKPGIDGYQMTLQNNSDVFLKVVAVDVYYYTTAGRIIDKETLYFSNIEPNGSKTLTAPSNRKADDVQYYLGLISSEQGLYFAKQ